MAQERNRHKNKEQPATEKLSINSVHTMKLRHEYLEVLAEAYEKKISGLNTKDDFYDLYKRTNVLLDEIETAPELNLDARVSGELIDLTGKKLNNLFCGGLIPFEDVIRLMQIPGTFERASAYVNTIYRGARFPQLLLLNLEDEEKERPAKKTKIKEETKELEQPKKEQKKELEQIDAPDKIKKIFEIIQKVEKIELLKLIVHPTDFSKTVENLLYLSFAIKLERAYIIESEKQYFVMSTKQEDIDKSHLILTITQEEAQEAIKTYQITHPLIE